MDKVISIIYVISFLTAYFGLVLLKKNNKKLNLIVNLSMFLVFMMCFSAAIEGIIEIAGFTFNLFTFIVANLILSSYCWYKIIIRKNKQQYYFNKSDLIFVGIIISIAIICFVLQFTSNLELTYQTSDPGVHYGLAMDTLRGESTTGMFYSEVNNALFIGSFLPFMSSVFEGYKLFIIFDGLMLILSGLVFWSLCQKYAKNTIHKVFMALLVILYMLAYPLTNMIFGFSYLGMSVNIIGLIIFLTTHFKSQLYDVKFSIFSLSISCFSLAVCYMLFAPIIWIIVLVNILIYFHEQSKLVSKECCIFCLSVFLIPTLLVIKFCFFSYFSSRGVNVGDSIKFEGGIYKNLFFNFILWLPLFTYGFVESFRKHKFDVYNLFFLGFTLFYGLLFILMYFNKISEYYFFKIYFPLWLLYMIIVVSGIYYGINKGKSVLISLCCAPLIMGGLFLARPQKYDIEVDSGRFFDIYSYNFDKLKNRRVYWPKLLDLYRFAIDDLQGKTDKVIPFFVAADNCEHWYWYEALSGEDSSEFYTWDIGAVEFLKKIKNKEVDYLFILNGDPLYQSHKQIFEQLEVIIENEDGKILRVN